MLANQRQRLSVCRNTSVYVSSVCVHRRSQIKTHHSRIEAEKHRSVLFPVSTHLGMDENENVFLTLKRGEGKNKLCTGLIFLLPFFVKAATGAHAH